MSKHELDDLYLGELEAPEQTQKNRKQPSGKESRTFAAAAVGALVGILVCAVVFALTASRTASTAAETSMDYQEKVDLILNYLRVYYLNDLNEDEIGDLFFAAVNVARLNKVDPDLALTAATDKFEKRFKLTEKLKIGRAHV